MCSDTCGFAHDCSEQLEQWVSCSDLNSAVRRYFDYRDIYTWKKALLWPFPNYPELFRADIRISEQTKIDFNQSDPWYSAPLRISQEKLIYIYIIRAVPYYIQLRTTGPSYWEPFTDIRNCSGLFRKGANSCTMLVSAAHTQILLVLFRSHNTDSFSILFSPG